MAKTTGKEASSKTARSGQFLEQHSNRKSASAVIGSVTSNLAPGVGVLATTRLKKAGGSLIMTVPASARNLLNLTDGQEMAVSVEGNRVVAEPVRSDKPMRVRRPKYTLDELVAGMNPDAPVSEEDRAWMDEPPIGREVW